MYQFTGVLINLQKEVTNSWRSKENHLHIVSCPTPVNLGCAVEIKNQVQRKTPNIVFPESMSFSLMS